MIWRLPRMVGGTVALLALIAPASSAETSGPQIAYLMRDRATSTVELRLAGPAGANSRVIAGGKRSDVIPGFGQGPSWSPDGRRLVFAGHGPTRDGIYLVRVADGKPRWIPGTRGGFAPVFSPDGRTIAFARMRLSRFVVPRKPGALPRIVGYDSVTIWTIRLDGGPIRPLTPWRPWVEAIPTSFSPDGSLLAASWRGEGSSVREDAVVLDIEGSGRRLISPQATAPSFSPDGSRFALISWLPSVRPKLGRYGWYRGGVTVVATGGSERRTFARTEYGEASAPSWDPAGARLVYHEGGDIVAINADGSCRTKILARTETRRFRAPAWRPGSGREAGRIDC